MRKFVAGESFITGYEITFDGGMQKRFVIPRGTLMTILEVSETAPLPYYVYFQGFGNEETDWLRMDAEEIEDLRQSAMTGY